MAFLTRKAVLEAVDITTMEVDVPEWGGKVLIKSMSGAEKSAYEKSLIEGKGKDVRQNISNHHSKLLARCICGEDGKRLFVESDIDALGNKSAVVLERLVKIAAEFNKMDEGAAAETLKNSETIPNSDSSTELLSP